ncbi:glutamine--fructose-6-phosphate transaminase (isomerizing) [Candidatus Micrarchaeota archaeon]|nr:glutamine--fructose-6-phosphate transaminase (isomerizing) [Candidatus Micrarchaeota archaeon]
MCGIIGYAGSGRASQAITDGLKRLEYRGYDSVGIAVLSPKSKLEVRKDKGMVEEVSSALRFTSIGGNIGLGHTRWATHGTVCRANAHPHADCTGSIVLAHNGVIENYAKLRDSLAAKGHKFASDTDSEVVAHLMEENAKTQPLIRAFMRTIGQLEGSYAIVAMSAADKEERLFIARRNSPLIIGAGKGEMLCASDIPAMLKYTRTFVPLQEGDMAILARNGYKIYSADGAEAERKQITVDWDMEMAKKGGYPHFMQKEISDQKHFINESLSSDTADAMKLICASGRIDIIAAGTSYHAGIMLSYLLQSTGRVAQAYIASDYPYIAKPDKKTLVIAISQSGETADVLQALRFAEGCRKIAITNVVGSTVTALADCVVFLNAGPEVGVAATKTFTSQLAVIYKLFYDKERLKPLSGLIGAMLEHDNEIKAVAQKIAGKENAFFIARGRNVPIAYEGSLKFKEITYIHSEAYPGGELKHGTLSLITPGVPVIALAPKDETLPKLLGNIREAKARGAFILSITDDDEVKKESDISIALPPGTDPILYPFALIVPLQLLAYHTSVLRGVNPDRPRNLAKSVTVE